MEQLVARNWITLGPSVTGLASTIVDRVGAHHQTTAPLSNRNAQRHGHKLADRNVLTHPLTSHSSNASAAIAKKGSTTHA